MAYSENIKSLIIGLCKKRSAEAAAKYLEELKSKNGYADLAKVAESLGVPFNDADWQQLLRGLPNPKTIRTWPSKEKTIKARQPPKPVSQAIHSKRVSHEDTRTVQRIREQAEILRKQINLPEVLSYFDFYPDHKPNRILFGNSGESGLFLEALYSHLKTSEFSGVLEDIKKWNKEIKRFYEKCCNFFKISVSKTEISAEFPDDKVENNEKPGYQRDFFASACADAVNIVNGELSATNIRFTIPGKSGYDLWNLFREGVGSIYIAVTKEEACEHQHEYLEIVKWLSENPQAKEIANLHSDLKQLAQNIQRQLLEFRHNSPLPGHCNLGC